MYKIPNTYRLHKTPGCGWGWEVYGMIGTAQPSVIARGDGHDTIHDAAEAVARWAHENLTRLVRALDN